MKLSNVAAKLTCMKSKAVRVLAAATLAGAVLAAAAPAAQAQRVVVGVRIGGPRYVVPAPVYYGPGPVYVAPWRGEWVRHDRFERDHRFYDHGYRR